MGQIATHSVLLVVALAVAYQTWTRDRSVKPVRAGVVLWSGAPGDVEELQLAGQNKKTVVARRSDAHGAYLWGTVEKTTTPPKRPPRPAAPDGGPPPAPEAEPAPVTTTREFPVGDEGDKLLEKLLPLKAVRDLGPLDEAKKGDYGLAEPKDRLTVKTKAGARELVLGARVYGGEDRYVMDPTTKRVYVLPGDVLRPLEGAESSLRERKLFGFEPDEVREVALKTTAAEKALVRGGAGAAATWASSSSPDKPDQTLANFMTRLGELTPVEFKPDLSPEGLTLVLGATYRGAGGKELGRLEVYKLASAAPSAPVPAPAPGAPAPAVPGAEYYVRTERTRVLAKLNAQVAERIDKDLAAILAP